MKSLKKYEWLIADISDERGLGDGIWVYLKKEFADFNHDPHYPTRQVHEQTVSKLLVRLRNGRVRKITDQDFYNYPHLRY